MGLKYLSYVFEFSARQLDSPCKLVPVNVHCRKFELREPVTEWPSFHVLDLGSIAFVVQFIREVLQSCRLNRQPTLAPRHVSVAIPPRSTLLLHLRNSLITGRHIITPRLSFAPWNSTSQLYCINRLREHSCKSIIVLRRFPSGVTCTRVDKSEGAKGVRGGAMRDSTMILDCSIWIHPLSDLVAICWEK